ncbi:serine/threonine-protein kinase [Zhihengliuella sp.]|uniref:serine/threonine-protein kinase n=1 Tax=Zhihengliuella sp. TaxID=1954483 RepID=UPI0028111144|nr:serine/threonine-protein kinase [Zhihengliuella sp.]
MVRTIGRGSTGLVYEVSARSAESPLALKIVSEGDGGWSGLRRRETEVLLALDHDYLVAVHGVARADVGTGLLMEMLPGGSVERLVQTKGALTPGQAVTVLAPMAAALDYLHGRDVTHGDISPANVLFTAAGMPKLTDFGLAGLLGRPGAAGRSAGFAAPELMVDPEMAAGPRQDVYAWGAVAWYVLTGRPPGPRATRPPLPSLVPEIGAGVAGLVEAALSEDARQRPSAAEAHTGIFEAGPAEPLDLVGSVDDVGMARLVTQLPASSRRRPGLLGALRGGGRAPQSPLFRAGAPAGPSGRATRSNGSRRPGRFRGATPGRGERFRRIALRAGTVALLGVALSSVALLLVGDREESTVQPTSAAGDSDDRTSQDHTETAEGRPGAPATPEEAVVALASARDVALEAADVDQLGRIYTGEESAARDLVIIGELAESGLRYSGLETSLTDVELIEREGPSATVEAVATIDAYEVETIDGAPVESMPAGEPVPLVLDLVWEEQAGWRISAIRQGPLPGA